MSNALLLGHSRLHRDALAVALRDRMRVVASRSSVADLSRRDLETHLDLILLQFELREGLLAIHQLRHRTPASRIVALDVPEDERTIRAWADAHVSGCVAKDDSFDDLLRVLDGVERGEVSCSPRIAAALFRPAILIPPTEAPTSADQPHLTARETEILRLVAAGLSNREIATALTLQLPTVKNHVHRIFDKLGIHARADATAFAQIMESRAETTMPFIPSHVAVAARGGASTAERSQLAAGC